MMKRLVSAVVGGMLATCAHTTAGLAKELVFASPFPPVHALNRFAIAPTLEAINKASGGELTFRFVPGGQLFGLRASLPSLGSRVADASVFLSMFYPGELKTHLITTDLFLAHDDPLVASAAATETIMRDCEDCFSEFKKNGTIFLAGYSTTNYQLMCKPDLKTVAELKGRKIKVSSVWGTLVSAMAAVPVNIPAAETVEAMQRGLIDCLMSPPEWLASYPGMNEVVKHVVDFGFGIGAGVPLFAMNLESWKSLSTAEKTLILRHMPQASAGIMVTGYDRYHARARDVIKKRNIGVTAGGNDFRTLMKDFRPASVENAIARAIKRGVKDPQSVVDTHMKNIAKWDKIVAGIDRTAEAYAKALWDNIYAEIDPDKL